MTRPSAPVAEPTANHASREPWRSRGLLANGVATLLLVASVAVLVGFFLSLYPPGQRSAPAGVDTPWYVWRSELVTAGGLDTLQGSVVPPYRAQPFRAGFPLIAAFLQSAMGITAQRLAFITPALMGTIIGLGAGAMAVRVLHEPIWAFPVYAVAVGASLNVTLTAVSHLDNLMVNGLLVAAAVAALTSDGGGRSMMAAIVLLGAAALTHWSFTAVFCALLLGLALLLAPQSIREHRRGARLLSIPSARIALTVGGAGALGAGALVLGPGWPELPARGTRELIPKLQRDVPRFLTLGPVAVGGAPALLIPPGRLRLHGLLFFLIWVASAGAALGLLWLGVSLPAHRFLHFALGIPFLAAAAVVGLGRLIWAIPPRALGGVLSLALMAVLVAANLLFVGTVWRPLPERHQRVLEQARVAGGYMAAVEEDRPVIFVVNPPAARQPLSTIRSALPTANVPRSHLFVGTVDDLLRGQPTVRDNDPVFTSVSQAHLEGVRPFLENAVIVSLAAFDRPGTEPPGTRLGQGVILVRGPPPTAPVSPLQAPSSPSTGELVRLTVVALLVLSLVGIGWSINLLPGSWLARVAVAPALGVAVLILAGALGNRIGADLPGARPWVLALVAILGWAFWVPSWFREPSPTHDQDPVPDDSGKQGS